MIGFGQDWTQIYFIDTLNSSYLANSVQQTSDGGYVIGAFISDPPDGGKIWLIKTDSIGDTIFTKKFISITFGGPMGRGYAQQTSDGGYIICGSKFSNGAGGYQPCLIKTDVGGNQQWIQTYPDSNVTGARGQSVQQTTDGGYIVSSTKYNIGVPGGNDLPCIIKTNGNGIKEWDLIPALPPNSNGSSYANASLNNIQQTTDGGYITCGNMNSGSGSMDDEPFLLKIDSVGGIQFSFVYSITGVNPQSSYLDFCHEVQQTTDGGYIIVGSTNFQLSNNGDVYLIKTDSTGIQEWTQTYGTVSTINGNNNFDGGSSVKQSNDGGFVVAMNSGKVLKTDSVGNQEWMSDFGDEVLSSVQQTTDGGFILCGSGTTSSPFGTPARLIKIDGLGCVNSFFTTSDTSCSNYNFNGTPYTTSGTFTWIGSNSIGCDSIVTLNLTIDNSIYSTSSTMVDNACNYYTWNGLNLITSGIYDTVLINSVGCDSTVNLELLINSSPSTSIILGNIQTNYLTLETYSVSQNIGSIFNWNLDNGGIILNGQTTNSIQVQWGNNSGMYHLYVIETDSNGCIGDTIFLNITIGTTSNIESLISSTDKKLISITDVLGQETPYRRNTPLFYIYDDGTVEKRIVIE